jgi:two-component system cell cycle sensor histidine kinase/response regulator CckA
MPAGIATSQAILVVDNESVARRSMARVLTRAGYRVFEADGADQAKKVIEAGIAPIALMVCDIRMPSAKGLELVRDLELAGSAPPTLYTSALVNSLVVQGIVKYNPRVMLIKPFTAKTLLSRVREMLALSKTSRLASVGGRERAAGRKPKQPD